MEKFLHKASFRSIDLLVRFRSTVVKTYYRLRGMRIGAGTVLRPMQVSWPHQVALGTQCVLEHHLQFKFDGIWQPGPCIIVGDRVFLGASCEFNIKRRISIGDDSLIGAGCRFIDHDHGTQIGQLMRAQPCPSAQISIGSDVWLGCNVVVLKGVNIGDGAIVGAGSIVTKTIGALEIWAGVPARLIGRRQ